MHRHQLPFFTCRPFIIHLTCLIYTHMALSLSYIIFALWDLCHQTGGILNKRTKGNWQHHGNISLSYFTFNRNVEEMDRLDPSCLRAASACRCSSIRCWNTRGVRQSLPLRGDFMAASTIPTSSWRLLGSWARPEANAARASAWRPKYCRATPWRK